MNETCEFVEPWVGKCKNPRAPGSLCCAKHTTEKCSVCGEQATTRCQASIGVMCGSPMCGLCGHGEMCIEHATSGPVAVIAALSGRGPRLGVFSDAESLAEDAKAMKEWIERIGKIDWGGLSMAAYEAAVDKAAVRD